MTLSDLRAKYERLLNDEVDGTLVPGALILIFQRIRDQRGLGSSEPLTLARLLPHPPARSCDWTVTP